VFWKEFVCFLCMAVSHLKDFSSKIPNSGKPYANPSFKGVCLLFSSTLLISSRHFVDFVFIYFCFLIMSSAKGRDLVCFAHCCKSSALARYLMQTYAWLWLKCPMSYEQVLFPF
jgi:hypothetical protein